MKKMKRLTAGALVIVMALSIMQVNAFAATRKKISQISLSVSADIKVGQDIGAEEIEIESKSSRYTVGDYEILNEGFSWQGTDIPKLKVYLYAEDEYYFAMTKASSVNLNGAGATYVSASKQDSSATLIVTMTLTPLSQTTGSIENARWSSIGLASWDAAHGAGEYEVKLYRDDNAVGTSKTTTECSYDFSSIMTKSANYSFKVRPVNKLKPDEKGAWSDSDSVFINEEQAAAFKSGSKPTGWLLDSSGYWFRNEDGSYPVSMWQEVNGVWYFFNENGYMVTGWVDWEGKWYYCDSTGAMLVNGRTPDGFMIGADGVMIP